MFGGGIKKGVLYGETAAERPLLTTKNPVSIRDLHATIFHAMGVSPKTAFDVEKRPFYATEDGKGVPVMNLFAKGKQEDGNSPPRDVTPHGSQRAAGVGEGRFQPRRAADPRGSLLPVPRSGRGQAESRSALRHRLHNAQARSGDCSAQAGRERTDSPHHGRRRERPDAASEVRAAAQREANRHAESVDRSRREVGKALGADSADDSRNTKHKTPNTKHNRQVRLRATRKGRHRAE